MRFFRLLAVAGIIAIPAAATAQQSGNHARATVLGVAVDSVRGGYLRGAIVSVSGTTLSAITDSMGRFRIDSVPAGSRYLELMHPLPLRTSDAISGPGSPQQPGQVTLRHSPARKAGELI